MTTTQQPFIADINTGSSILSGFESESVFDKPQVPSAPVSAPFTPVPVSAPITSISPPVSTYQAPVSVSPSSTPARPPPRPAPPAVPERPKVPPAKPPLPKPPVITAKPTPVLDQIQTEIKPQPFESQPEFKNLITTGEPEKVSSTNIFDVNNESQNTDNINYFNVNGMTTSEQTAFKEDLFFETEKQQLASPIKQPQIPIESSDLFGTNVNEHGKTEVELSNDTNDFFATSQSQVQPSQPTYTNIFDSVIPSQQEEKVATPAQPAGTLDDAFDAFAAKFESVEKSNQKSDPFDAFNSSSAFGDTTQEQNEGNIFYLQYNLKPNKTSIKNIF